MAKQIKYTDEFRKESVKSYINGNLSAAQLSLKLGVHKHTLCRWIKIYGQEPLAIPCKSNEQTNALMHINAINMHIAALEKIILM